MPMEKIEKPFGRALEKLLDEGITRLEVKTAVGSRENWSTKAAPCLADSKPTDLGRGSAIHVNK
jgi:hypothetical protein